MSSKRFLAPTLPVCPRACRWRCGSKATHFPVSTVNLKAFVSKISQRAQMGTPVSQVNQTFRMTVIVIFLLINAQKA